MLLHMLFSLLLADARAPERKFPMPTGLPTTNSTNKYPNVKQLSWAINYILGGQNNSGKSRDKLLRIIEPLCHAHTSPREFRSPKCVPPILPSMTSSWSTALGSTSCLVFCQNRRLLRLRFFCLVGTRSSFVLSC